MATLPELSYSYELLEKFGKGLLSAKGVCEHASGKAVAAAKSPVLIERLAALGRHPLRALDRLVAKEPWRKLLPELYEFSCTKHLGPMQGVQPATHYCILPHEVFSNLATQSPELFYHVFGEPGDWADFWKGEGGAVAAGVPRGGTFDAAAAGAAPTASAAADTAATTSSDGATLPVAAGTVATTSSDGATLPVAAGPPGIACRPLRMPIGMHGDDAGVHAGEKVLVLTWGSLTSNGSPLDSRLVFTLLRHSESLFGANVEDQAYDVLVWSLRALAQGFHPRRAHDGSDFTDPRRLALAGAPLVLEGGARVVGIFRELRGDWKYLKEVLHLQQHYLRNNVCHKCPATKKEGPNFFADFRRCAGHRGKLRTHHAWAHEQRAQARPCPLLGVPGFRIEFAFFDILHTLDIGVLQVAVPSALHEVTRDERLFEGSTVKARLHHATARYHRWCKVHGVTDKAALFTERWVQLPHPKVKMVHCKGAAMRHLVYWLESELATLRGRDRVHRMLWAFFYFFCLADSVMVQGGRHLTRLERRRLARTSRAALQIYRWHHERAKATGVAIWSLLPKHHAWSHMAFDNAGTNPRKVSCYLDEDIVGRMKRLYVRRHPVTAPATALMRYTVLLSMHWLRVLRRIHPMLGDAPSPKRARRG